MLFSSKSVNVDESLKNAVTSIKRNGVALKGVFIGCVHRLWFRLLIADC